MTIISIDLACKRYSDIGVAILRDEGTAIDATVSSPPLQGAPNALSLAEWIGELSAKHSATYIFLDGPQGWKRHDSTLKHSRACESAFNTPAKTGTKGTVKPATYTRFAQFSINVFEALTTAGLSLFGFQPENADRCILFESFPFGAWRKLEIPHLPSKAKATQRDTDVRLASLQQMFTIPRVTMLNHDQLQALVAGIAGIQIHRGGVAAVSICGEPPIRPDGFWCEGFIVCPKKAGV